MAKRTTQAQVIKTAVLFTGPEAWTDLLLIYHSHIPLWGDSASGEVKA